MTGSEFPEIKEFLTSPQRPVYNLLRTIGDPVPRGDRSAEETGGHDRW